MKLMEAVAKINAALHDDLVLPGIGDDVLRIVPSDAEITEEHIMGRYCPATHQP